MMTTQNLWITGMGMGFFGFLLLSPAQADVKSKAAQEAAEFVLKKFAVKESLESLAQRIEKLAAEHGDEALAAVRKVGPKCFPLVEEAGASGTRVVKLLARYGDDAAIWVVSRPRSMAMFVKFGDNAAAALVKHKGIAEPVIEKFGEPAIRALTKVDPENGRRLAMMVDEGDLARIGRAPEMLAVVEKHGDRAMDFVWKHKGSLAVATGLTAFLAHPEPFLDGAVDITKVVAKPIADVPGQVAAQAAREMNWTFVAFSVCVVGLLVGWRVWHNWRAKLARIKPS